ncbi:hypothetical protein ACFFK0_28040 [Paenibacillus chartarius]|uniref:Uncharacterized protein n=1 Tax=Paenibacillus chartarius TaxID=747481 RepID=A0ABV6DUB4_9BACL
MTSYRWNVGNRSIAGGTALELDSVFSKPPIDPFIKGEDEHTFIWNLPNGVYQARDIVKALNVLLQAVVVRLGGKAADAETLLDALQASLAISGRESTLPLESLQFGVQVGIELTRQAELIGETLVRWVRELNLQQGTLEEAESSVLSRLAFRSKCDNHLWTDQATDLLTGAAGGPVVMQLYNEYLHQFVLLRNALLPFANWEEVPIEIREGRKFRGLRFLEEAHTEFLSKLLSKRITHRSIVKFAQSFLSPDLDIAGYGFQYRYGTILPASLGLVPDYAPRYLLQWYPVKLTGGDESDAVAFDYAYSDYYSAPRSEAGHGQTVTGRTVSGQELVHIREARLVTSMVEPMRALIAFQLPLNSVGVIEVDLGQAFRGHRFMYRQEQDQETISELKRMEPYPYQVHQAGDILERSGLVTNQSGVHFIATGGNALVKWVLLGKLYPENVILIDRSDDAAIAAADKLGKKFGAKFIIY